MFCSPVYDVYYTAQWLHKVVLAFEYVRKESYGATTEKTKTSLVTTILHRRNSFRFFHKMKWKG